MRFQQDGSTTIAGMVGLILLLCCPLSWELNIGDWKYLRHHTRDLRHTGHMSAENSNLNGSKSDSRTRPNAVHNLDHTTKTSNKFFLNPNHTVVLAQLGATATLHCEPSHLGDSTISWIRRKDYQLLTVGLTTYSSDDRFFTAHGKNLQDWTLHIRFASEKDAGLYECQISTHPPVSLFVELQLVEAHADIVGGPDKIVKAGSSLLLTCVLRKSTETPAYVFWYHGERMINFDLGGGAAVRHGRQSSELLIPQVQMHHAGNYSCVPSNARPANVNVHVVQMEAPAAMQHEKNKSNSNQIYSSTYFLNVIISSVLVQLLR